MKFDYAIEMMVVRYTTDVTHLFDMCVTAGGGWYWIDHLVEGLCIVLKTHVSSLFTLPFIFIPKLDKRFLFAVYRIPRVSETHFFHFKFIMSWKMWQEYIYTYSPYFFPYSPRWILFCICIRIPLYARNPSVKGPNITRDRSNRMSIKWSI